jgi:hypothetical protein
MSDDAAIRAYAGEKHFGPATLERWLEQPPAGGAALLDIATRLRLGENQFRDVLDDLVAIGARQGCDIAEIASGTTLRAVLARGLGRNEAVKAFKAALRRLRYPQLSATEQRIDELGKSLKLPAGVRLELPENLEGEHVVVTLRARSANELRAQARAVVTVLQGAALDEMFALLDGEWRW